MKVHPEIIELCGIPGCGKTTLCNNLPNKAKNVGTMLDVLYFYRGLNMLSKIKLFPYGAILKLFHSFFFFPTLPMKQWYLYFNFIKLIVLYGMCRGMKNFDYIVSDHGIIQSFVGLLYNHENELSQIRYNKIAKVINTVQPLRILLCEIPVQVSILRIRDRNRSYGRLDVIKDNNVLAEKLSKQERLFKYVYSKCINDNLYCKKINMDTNLDDVIDHYFVLICESNSKI